MIESEREWKIERKREKERETGEREGGEDGSENAIIKRRELQGRDRR